MPVFFNRGEQASDPIGSHRILPDPHRIPTASHCIRTGSHRIPPDPHQIPTASHCIPTTSLPHRYRIPTGSPPHPCWIPSHPYRNKNRIPNTLQMDSSRSRLDPRRSQPIPAPWSPLTPTLLIRLTQDRLFAEAANLEAAPGGWDKRGGDRTPLTQVKALISLCAPSNNVSAV